MGDPFRIRTLRPSDLDAIGRIERAVFTDPWTADALAWAARALALVAERDAVIAGYLFARRAADEGEILNLAVRPEDRRSGLATALVQAACDCLGAEGARVVFLEVRESNAAARAFYAARGFEEIARRRQYYRRPPEDALVLARSVAPPPAHEPPPR